MDANDIRNGYVETDNQSDSHGFKRTEKKAWVRFHFNPLDIEVQRSVWVDYLGVWWVLDFEMERFERLDHGGEVWDWHWQQA